MFKVDDKVWSYSLQEWGEVKYIGYKHNSYYPIRVEFTSIGERTYTADGKSLDCDRVPDLFFEEVRPPQQKRPLQHKDIVKCKEFDASCEFLLRFYDRNNNCTFMADGDPNGMNFEYMEFVPDSEAPQELVAMRNKLKD